MNKIKINKGIKKILMEKFDIDENGNVNTPLYSLDFETTKYHRQMRDTKDGLKAGFTKSIPQVPYMVSIIKIINIFDFPKKGSYKKKIRYVDNPFEIKQFRWLTQGINEFIPEDDAIILAWNCSFEKRAMTTLQTILPGEFDRISNFQYFEGQDMIGGTKSARKHGMKMPLDCTHVVHNTLMKDNKVSATTSLKNVAKMLEQHIDNEKFKYADLASGADAANMYHNMYSYCRDFKGDDYGGHQINQWHLKKLRDGVRVNQMDLPGEPYLSHPFLRIIDELKKQSHYCFIDTLMPLMLLKTICLYGSENEDVIVDKDMKLC